MFLKALPIFSFISVAFATVYVTLPVATTTCSGGKPCTLSWEDSPIAPTLPLFGLATIAIYVGNAKQQTNLQSISNSTNVATTSTLSFTADPTIGPSGNAYFIRFDSITGKDNTSTPYQSFSAKFTLDSMTGNFSAAVEAQIAGQSTAPLGGPTSSGSAGPTSTPSVTASTASRNSTSTSSTTATARPSSGAMGLNVGWAGAVFGAVVGVAMF